MCIMQLGTRKALPNIFKNRVVFVIELQLGHEPLVVCDINYVGKINMMRELERYIYIYVCVYGIQGRLFEPLSRKIAGHSHLLQASEQCFCIYIYMRVCVCACVSMVFKEGFSNHYQEKK